MIYSKYFDFNSAKIKPQSAAVRAALIPLGIAATRLVTSGFGSSVPRDVNATLARRARNRRVELTQQ